MNEPERIEFVRGLYADRFRAHQLLFPHRHPNETAYAHQRLCEAIYSPYARQLIEGFRGCAKSTWLEETAILRALFGEYHNLVIVGSSYERGCERLIPIKHELQYNQMLIGLFGKQAGKPWHEGKIVLRSGICIQALGRDQAMTGIKHGDWRPDAALIDDVEDPEEVRTDQNREQTWKWLMTTFLPSLDDFLGSWVRVLGTRRGNGSLPERLEKAGWPTLKLPLYHLDDKGERKATWPGKFPLAKVAEIERTYRGDMHLFMQEFMCEAVSEADRTFGHIKVFPRPRSWQMADAMYDPARSTTRRSATTGWAVASWLNEKLVVWDAGADRWQPSELIQHMFDINKEHKPRWIGFEEDGLSEWAKQPIRAEMMRRRVLLPLLPLRAPRDRSKINFIRGLQAYYAAGQIEFAKPLPELQDQLLSFPTGDIDAPNALSYFLLMKPGLPVYDNFTEDNIVEGLEPIEGHPLFLAASADGSLVTAALVQRAEGEIRILADWVREGGPAELVAEIHSEAALTAETGQWTERLEYGEGEHEFKLPVRVRGWANHPIRWIVPGRHQEMYQNVGLVQAIRAIPQGVSASEREAGERGRAALAGLLDNHRQGRPRVLVSSAAQWTVRAFAGGYARGVDRRGLAEAAADSGLYTLLMEGIEAFCAIGTGAEKNAEEQQPLAFDRRGVAYRSAMPERFERGHR